MNKLVIEKLDDGIPSPKYALEGDGGFDCYSSKDMTLTAGEFTHIPLGIRIELPKGCVALLLPKSGLSSKGLTATVGLIDNGYRGEVSMMAHNISDKEINVKRGQKVCQIMVMQLPEIDIVYDNVNKDTERGSNGFGSTGL